MISEFWVSRYHFIENYLSDVFLRHLKLFEFSKQNRISIQIFGIERTLRCLKIQFRKVFFVGQIFKNGLNLKMTFF